MNEIDIFQQNINSLFSKYKDEFYQLEDIWKYHIGGAEIGYFESQLAYVLVREYKPEVIFEIGPNCGFSTYPLALGIKNNGYGKMYSFEKDNSVIDILTKNLENAKLEDIVTIISGDYRFTSIDIVKSVEKIDVLWIDNGHDFYTAKWYIANLFSHVKQLVFVHDMTYGTPNPFDEKHIVSEFLKKYPYPNILLRDYFKNTKTENIEKRDGPGGSANSGIWIDMTQKGW